MTGIGKSRRTPLRITDTTLRDGHQSLWATRMRSRDILDIIDTIDSVGYYSLEVWGGATFDVCLRFLRENPWERLRQIKAHAKKTPLQMLLRGQNILGYRNYPDDLLDRFVALACANGIDIFRIFDALNDTRNLEQAIKSVKKHGGHAQGTLCYTISPVHTIKKFVEIAKEQVQMGIDSLAIKDMAGILSPIAAEKLVSALVNEVKVPIQMHCHATSGMAVSAYVEGVRAGARAIDCAISPMAGYSSQPPVETMISIFQEMPYYANLDQDALRTICKYFLDLAPKRQLSHHPINIIDPDILLHHIPGGMISNLRSQLQQQNALDKLDDVLLELPKVREDFGYPPLVTPTSQIVGIQAVMNVLSGKRYSMVPQETKDYVKGLYGQPPTPIDPKIRKKILGREKVITCRPANLLKPILPTVTNDVDPKLINSEEDIISYCLFPEPALEYLKWRNLPTEERPAPPVELEQKKDEKPEHEPAPPVKPFLTQTDYIELRGLLDKVSELQFSEVLIRRNDLSLNLKKTSGLITSHSTVEKTSVQNVQTAELVDAPKPALESQQSSSIPPSSQPVKTDHMTIDAPLNGTFYLSPAPSKPPFVKEGDAVKRNDTVCIVEAMKLFNPIKAPTDCRIVRFMVKHGDSVEKGQPLIVIEND
ncbi:MAG: pyruvate carboxylase subunit B [Lentisphaerae bacterium]|nr:pyruvate carboxylase subunit B [Lentisphaerota bacterium]